MNWIKTAKKEKLIFITIIFGIIGLLISYVTGFLYSGNPNSDNTPDFAKNGGAIGLVWTLRYWTIQTNIFTVFFLTYIIRKISRGIELTTKDKKIMLNSSTYIAITGLVWTLILFPISAVNEWKPSFIESLTTTQLVGWSINRLSDPFVHVLVPLFAVIILVKNKLFKIDNKVLSLKKLLPIFLIYPIIYFIFGVIIYYTTNNAIYFFFAFKDLKWLSIPVVAGVVLAFLLIYLSILKVYKKKNSYQEVLETNLSV